MTDNWWKTIVLTNGVDLYLHFTAWLCLSANTFPVKSHRINYLSILKTKFLNLVETVDCNCCQNRLSFTFIFSQQELTSLSCSWHYLAFYYQGLLPDQNPLTTLMNCFTTENSNRYLYFVIIYMYQITFSSPVILLSAYFY